MSPALTELALADSAEAWERAGFAVEHGAFRVGSVTLRLVDGPGRGIVAWALTEVEAGVIDGLPTSAGEPRAGAAPPHPNGSVAIDHVVVVTGDLERTTAAFEAAGIECRRLREAGRVRQAFFRVGEAIVEVVASPDTDGPTRFWGVVFVAADLERCAELLGDALGEIHDAVQPGRRIATVRRSAGLALPVAFMTPRPPR